MKLFISDKYEPVVTGIIYMTYLNFLISQGSAAICLRCGGKYYVGLIKNFNRLSSCERMLKIG